MQAIFDGRSETSKLSILRAPLSPASRRRQLVSTPQPSGVTIPIPVTTTRRICGLSRLGSSAARLRGRPNAARRDLFHTGTPDGKSAVSSAHRPQENPRRAAPPLSQTVKRGKLGGVQLLAFFSKNFTASPTVRMVSAA